MNLNSFSLDKSLDKYLGMCLDKSLHESKVKDKFLDKYLDMYLDKSQHESKFKNSDKFLSELLNNCLIKIKIRGLFKIKLQILGLMR